MNYELLILTQRRQGAKTLLNYEL